MGRDSKIEWTHHTFSPWWGCTKVSAGCKFCYAEAFDARFKGEHWGPTSTRKFFGENHWRKPINWNRKAEEDGERRRVFCASMSDVFEEHANPEINAAMDAYRQRLWRIIEKTPHLDWLLLTKRPENHEMVPLAWQTGSRPMPNVWLGCTAENQEQADKNIPHLLAAPWPALRFVSYEPAIGPLNLDPPCCRYGCDVLLGRDSVPLDEGLPYCVHCGYSSGFGDWLQGDGIDWVIVGAESGKNARPMDEDWVRSVRDQCAATSTPFFYKQRIEGRTKVSMPLLDGVVHNAFPVVL